MAAERAGLLGRLLGDGLTVIHAGSAAVFGAGRLGGYLVRSDTRARVFAECAAPTLGGRDTPEGLLLRCGTDEPSLNPCRHEGIAPTDLAGDLRTDHKLRCDARRPKETQACAHSGWVES
jgi:hypothetical protein